MSETRDLVREAAERLFEKHCSAETMRRADGGEFPQALWRALTDAGHAAALVPENAGGAGLEMADALSLLISAGRHAVPAPLAETMLAGWLLLNETLTRIQILGCMLIFFAVGLSQVKSSISGKIDQSHLVEGR